MFPGNPIFWSESFGDLPICFIEKYMAIAEEVELERLEREARPVAALGFYFLQSKGVKEAETSMINSFERLANIRRAQRFFEFNRQLPVTILELEKENLIPSWAQSQIDMTLVRDAVVAN